MTPEQIHAARGTLAMFDARGWLPIGAEEHRQMQKLRKIVLDAWSAVEWVRRESGRMDADEVRRGAVRLFGEDIAAFAWTEFRISE